MAVRQSLGAAVVKWLCPTSRQTARVVTVHRSPSGRIVSVYVEAQTADGPRALFFFRHADRGWQVFPPETMRPSMGLGRVAA
ncbi:hypothetical protein VSR34_17985 [Paraburkholderia sp. JHI2823]|uniref:hypothetical protein n=1 Tax=Paraburkholderia TaxID=1822464 RepID=UPI000480618E|nr:hypothetical protein [Paraburkholderia mimosarum]